MTKKKGLGGRVGGYISRRTIIPGLGGSRNLLVGARNNLRSLPPIRRQDIMNIWNGPTKQDGLDLFQKSAGAASQEERDQAISGINQAMLVFSGFMILFLLAWFFGVVSGFLGIISSVAVILMTGLALTILHHQKNQIRERRIMGLKETVFGK